MAAPQPREQLQYFANVAKLASSLHAMQRVGGVQRQYVQDMAKVMNGQMRAEQRYQDELSDLAQDGFSLEDAKLVHALPEYKDHQSFLKDASALEEEREHVLATHPSASSVLSKIDDQYGRVMEKVSASYVKLEGRLKEQFPSRFEKDAERGSWLRKVLTTAGVVGALAAPSYGQIADTVKVDLKTPDGTGQGDVSVLLDNDALNLHYAELTDSNGVATFVDVPTPVHDQHPMVLKGYRLDWGYPNPVENALFKFRYQVPTDAIDVNVHIKVYDITGREVRSLVDEQLRPGVYESAWDGRNERGVPVADGVYLYSMVTDEGMLTKKMVVLGGDAPRLSSQVPKRLGDGDQGSVSKQNGIEYQLSTQDDRFVDLSDDVVIEGDTTFFRTLQEAFSYTGPSQLHGNEGDTLGVAFDWFEYGTALDSLLNESSEWQVVGADQDSLYLTPTDPQGNGNIPLLLKARGQFQTENGVVIPTNIADLVTWEGQFVDDMKYKKLLNEIEPGAGLKGEIYVNGKTFVTDADGNFSFRLPASGNYTVQVQGVDGSDTTTYKPSFVIQGVDQDDLVLHAMPYWPLEQLGLTAQDGYDFAWEGNFAPGPGSNVTGLKRVHLDTGEHWLARKHPNLTDTMTVEEQNYLASVIEDSLNSRMQTPLSIYMATLQDTVPLSRRDGVDLWSVDRNGPAGSIGIYDENLDGLLDFQDIQVTAGTPQELGAILQEGASGIFGPWPVFNPDFFGKTVIHEAGGNPGYITGADDWLLRLVENYDNLENIDNVLGGNLVSYMKNEPFLNKLVDKIELDPKNYKLHMQEFIKSVRSQ